MLNQYGNYNEPFKKPEMLKRLLRLTDITRVFGHLRLTKNKQQKV
jgi:hypothetical protein